MEKLFGIPIDQLMVTLFIILVIGAAATGLVAMRNIPRRRAQTGLIVFGLMLATILFSASFATGDTQ